MVRTQKTRDNSSVIARRLKEARLRAGVSQKTLGIRAGIDEFSSSARVNQYERGKHVPAYSTLERFADVLNVPTEFFYSRDNVVAEMLILFFNLSPQQKTRCISFLRKLGKQGETKEKL